MKRHESSRAVPEPLRKRGLMRAVEIAPHADFRIAGVGAQLGVLFRDELQRRLAARKANEEAASA